MILQHASLTAGCKGTPVTKAAIYRAGRIIAHLLLSSHFRNLWNQHTQKGGEEASSLSRVSCDRSICSDLLYARWSQSWLWQNHILLPSWLTVDPSHSAPPCAGATQTTRLLFFVPVNVNSTSLIGDTHFFLFTSDISPILLWNTNMTSYIYIYIYMSS